MDEGCGDEVHTSSTDRTVKSHRWSAAKGDLLRAHRGVGFETVLVPYAEGDDHLFLKTVVPSRKATRACLGGRNDA